MIKDRVYIAIISALLIIHSYFIFPKIYMVSLISGCRDSAYSEGSHIFNQDIYYMVIIILISYILIILLGLSIYKVIKRKRWLLYSITATVVLAVIIFFSRSIYGAYIWIENTFTTEMRVYAGPLPFNQLTIERGKFKKYGPLVIDVIRNERTEKLENIFSDIDTDDWILTTIFIAPVGSHWESHPIFLFLTDSQMQRVEMIEKKYVNYLFARKVKENKIPEIFMSEAPIYDEFWKYIFDADSAITDKEKLNMLYTQIDSLISKGK